MSAPVIKKQTCSIIRLYDFLKFIQKDAVFNISNLKIVRHHMFNSVNNPFKRTIESSTSSDKNKHQNQQEKKEQEKKYLEQEEQDEVKLGGLPLLSEDEVLSMTKSYINNLKTEHEENEKIIKKLDKYLANFDIKKFMQKNPSLTAPDFYMVMYNETENLVK